MRSSPSDSDQLLSPVQEHGDNVSPAHSNSNLLEIDGCEDSSDSEAEIVDSYVTLV